MADRVGQQLGNYQLIRLLGEGGFAEVYLGEHIHLGTQAAIKVLHTQLTSDDVDKFRTEARTIARLIHPHIVRVLEFGVEGKTPFLVMDYAPNGTLRQRHPKGVALPLPIIVSYVKQVADALQYAHDEKLIHRDIKPENILLGRRNDILLSDFGIALVAQSSRYQSAQEMAGTMAYMAPEQIQGKPRPASDQYSLGIVVYEWLSGDRPFHGSLSELVGQHLSILPSSLHEKIPGLPPTVEEVVLTALAKDPKARFSSVQAFAIALEESSQIAPSSSIAQSTELSLSSSSSRPTNPVADIPSIQLIELTDTIIPSSHSSQLAYAITPSSTSASPPSVRNSELSEGAQLLLPPQGRILRRAVIIGLIGLAGVSIAGGGIAWLARSQKSQVFSPSSHPTPATTLTPTVTSGVVKIQNAGLKIPNLLQWGATSTFGAPFVFLDPTNQNKLVGVEVEIADAIAKLMDVTPKQIERDYGQLESALLSNQFDMIMNGWIKTSDREKTELFSDPYYRYGQQIVVRRDDGSMSSSV